MKWIEEVRDALELAQMDYIYEGDDKINPALKYTWEGTAGLMFTCIEKALAAIPDEDPMVKLLRWVTKKEVTAEHEYRRSQGVLEQRPALFQLLREWRSFEEVRKYIEREFGYKPEKE